MKCKLDNFTVEEVQQIVNSSSTKTEVAIKLGYSSGGGTVNKALNKYFEQHNIDTSSITVHKPNKKYTRQMVFTQFGTIAQHSLVDWYKKEDIPYKCSICGQQPFWNGKPLIMILDHINGIHTDDRLENLRWVCPNCNYQLETTGSRNAKNYKK